MLLLRILNKIIRDILLILVRFVNVFKIYYKIKYIYILLISLEIRCRGGRNKKIDILFSIMCFVRKILE